MNIVMTEEQQGLDTVALDLLRSAARLTRVTGRIPGVRFSSIAWRVLADLDLSGAQRVSDLAVQQSVAQPTMTSLIHRLEREGWVSRTRDPADGRAVLVAATQAGVMALSDYRRRIAAAVSPKLDRYTEDEIETLERASQIMWRIADEF